MTDAQRAALMRLSDEFTAMSRHMARVAGQLSELERTLRTSTGPAAAMAPVFAPPTAPPMPPPPHYAYPPAVRCTRCRSLAPPIASSEDQAGERTGLDRQAARRRRRCGHPDRCRSPARAGRAGRHSATGDPGRGRGAAGRRPGRRGGDPERAPRWPGRRHRAGCHRRRRGLYRRHRLSPPSTIGPLRQLACSSLRSSAAPAWHWLGAGTHNSWACWFSVPLTFLAPIVADGVTLLLVGFMLVLSAAALPVQLGRDWTGMYAARTAAVSAPLLIALVAASFGTGRRPVADRRRLRCGRAVGGRRRGDTAARDGQSDRAGAADRDGSAARAVGGHRGQPSAQRTAGRDGVAHHARDRVERPAAAGRPRTVRNIWAALSAVAALITVTVAFDGYVGGPVLLAMAAVAAVAGRRDIVAAGRQPVSLRPGPRSCSGTRPRRH